MRESNPSDHLRCLNKRILVIGLGNPVRSDDGIGVAIARRLQARTPDCVHVALSGGDIISLLEAWRGFDDVILIDAMMADDAPGQFRWFDVSTCDLPEQTFPEHSTHTFGLHQAVAMARALGELPRNTHVVGVQGGNFAAGSSLSDAVERAVDAVVASVLDRVTAWEDAHA